MSKVLVGTTILVWATFRHLGTPTDPDTVTLYIHKPDGNIDTETSGFTDLEGEARVPGSGIYGFPLPLDQVDNWVWIWKGTGAAAAVKYDLVRVYPLPFVVP
jgi:hypothetical protein